MNGCEMKGCEYWSGERCEYDSTSCLYDLTQTGIGKIKELKNENTELCQAKEELLDMLNRLQFMYYVQKGNSIIKVCPICKHEHRQHRDGCSLNALMNKYAKKERDEG